MREVENAGILHKSDNDYNKYVVQAIKMAKRARNPRDYLDVYSGTKDFNQINEEIEWEVER